MLRRHATAARRRELFPILCVAASATLTLFMGTTVLTIAANGITHLGLALASDEVMFSLRMSAMTSSVSTALCMALALPCAWAMTRGGLPGSHALEILVELTLSLPYVVLGFALLVAFSSPLGVALREHGISVVFQPAGIVLAQMAVNVPFALRMSRTALCGVDPRMEFVARTLGAGSWDVFRTITLPMCRNPLVSALVLTWARGMGEFGATLMLVGVTRMRTETLPGSIFLSISTGDTSTAMSTAMIMLLVSAVALAVANALGRRRTSRAEGGFGG